MGFFFYCCLWSLHNSLVTESGSGFALPIAIVAKCEEIINLAQKIVIWRQLLAKEKSLAKIFVYRRNVTSTGGKPRNYHEIVLT